jgi:hypothetical protein
MIQLPYDIKYLIVTHLALDINTLLRCETKGRGEKNRKPEIFKTLRTLQLTDKTFNDIVRNNPASLALYRQYAKHNFEYPYAFRLLDMWRSHGMNDFARRQLKRYTRFGQPSPVFLGDVDKSLSPDTTYLGPAELKRLHTDRNKLMACVEWVRQKFGYGDGRLEKLDLLRGYYIAISLARHFVPLPIEIRKFDLKPKAWRSSVGRETCSNQGVFNHLAYLRLPTFDFRLLCDTYRDASARDAFKTYTSPFDLNSWRMDFGAIDSIFSLRRKTSLHIQIPDQLQLSHHHAEMNNAFYWVQPFRRSLLGGGYESGWDEDRILLPAKIVQALEKAIDGDYTMLWDYREDGNYIELMVPEMSNGTSNGIVNSGC